MFRTLWSLFSHDLAIDLGTANTLVHIGGTRGVVINEPSIVAINTATGAVEAIGTKAKRMIGRTSSAISAIRPMKDGVIADFKTAEQMLTHFISTAHERKLFVHPRIIIGVPGQITHVEKKAVMDSALRAGASEVHLVEQAMMAAIGAGLPVTEPTGSMVVDIGGGTTDVAVISMSGIVTSKSVDAAGHALDEAIVQHLKRKHKFLIGERTAERIKIEIGSASPQEDQEPLSLEVKGRNLIRGVPDSLTVTDREVAEAISRSVDRILVAIRETLERTPPELSGDICERGIVLTGGGANLRNLDILIKNETDVPVSIADEPLQCVVLGTANVLKDIQLLRRIAVG